MKPEDCPNFRAGRVPCACTDGEEEVQLLKRPRMQRGDNENGSNNPRCQIAGCTGDLTVLKGYHKRHRVCEEHARVSTIFHDGKVQRYCQQCGRFHVLADFDEGKRSCRRKLERHNTRRRHKNKDKGKGPSAPAPASAPRKPKKGDSQEQATEEGEDPPGNDATREGAAPLKEEPAVPAAAAAGEQERGPERPQQQQQPARKRAPPRSKRGEAVAPPLAAAAAAAAATTPAAAAGGLQDGHVMEAKQVSASLSVSCVLDGSVSNSLGGLLPPSSQSFQSLPFSNPSTEAADLAARHPGTSLTYAPLGLHVAASPRLDIGACRPGAEAPPPSMYSPHAGTGTAGGASTAGGADALPSGVAPFQPLSSDMWQAPGQLQGQLPPQTRHAAPSGSFLPGGVQSLTLSETSRGFAPHHLPSPSSSALNPGKLLGVAALSAASSNSAFAHALPRPPHPQSQPQPQPQLQACACGGGAAAHFPSTPAAHPGEGLPGFALEDGAGARAVGGSCGFPSLTSSTGPGLSSAPSHPHLHLDLAHSELLCPSQPQAQLQSPRDPAGASWQARHAEEQLLWARQQMQNAMQPPRYASATPSGRMSFKLYDWNPGDFPRRIRHQVQADVGGSLQALTQGPGAHFWGQGRMLVQVQQHLTSVDTGHIDYLGEIRPLDRPHLTGARPLCIVAGRATPVKLAGHNLRLPHTRVICSFGGRHVVNESVRPPEEDPEHEGAGTAAGKWWQRAHAREREREGELGQASELESFQFPSVRPGAVGTAFVEVEHGAGCSNFLPILVASEEVCREVQTLEHEILAEFASSMRQLEAAHGGALAGPDLEQAVKRASQALVAKEQEVRGLIADLGAVLHAAAEGEEDDQSQQQQQQGQVAGGEPAVHRMRRLPCEVARLQGLLHASVTRGWVAVTRSLLRAARRLSLSAAASPGSLPVPSSYSLVARAAGGVRWRGRGGAAGGDLAGPLPACGRAAGGASDVLTQVMVGPDGFSLLHRSVARGDVAVAELLLQFAAAEARACGGGGSSGAAARSALRAELKWWEIGYQSDAGLTVLHMAALQPQPSCERLLERLIAYSSQADLLAWTNARDARGKSPMDYALLAGNASANLLIARKLVSAPARASTGVAEGAGGGAALFASQLPSPAAAAAAAATTALCCRGPQARGGSDPASVAISVSSPGHLSQQYCYDLTDEAERLPLISPKGAGVGDGSEMGGGGAGRPRQYFFSSKLQDLRCSVANLQRFRVALGNEGYVGRRAMVTTAIVLSACVGICVALVHSDQLSLSIRRRLMSAFGPPDV
eukprot:jgi/Mesen1/8545/ME000484S07938